MNIEEAKKEIKNTVMIYSRKENGKYVLPTERQRPILLIGAPGIGKTAVMKQVADELGIGFVSYAITHHTRQSAIGLPFIAEKTFGGKKYSVTEYTMSEIVASVYDAIENQGKKEGILFIDEINCVSETLAPAMLELLQHKKFGPHLIPEGWILTSAGNPNEYNKSANELDMVTLDRVKKIDVEPDHSAFSAYAEGRGVHSAIIGFLGIDRDCLFKAERSENGFSFVTPRGWEDLSVALKEYERFSFDITYDLIRQYIQDGDVASKFFSFYKTYKKAGGKLDLKKIESGEQIVADMSEADAEEKFALAEILNSAITLVSEEALSLIKADEILKSLLREKGDFAENAKIFRRKESLASSDFQKSVYKAVIGVLESDEPGKEIINFSEKANAIGKENAEKIARLLTFAENSLGKNQELNALVASLIAKENFLAFVSEFECEKFVRLNSELLIADDRLKNKAKTLLKQ